MTAFLCIVVSCDKVSTSSILEEPVVNAEAQLFYANLAEIIKATTSFQVYTKSQAYDEHENLSEFYLTHDIEYPLFAKLASIDILTEEGNHVSFFDLPMEEQSRFIEEFAHHEAEMLSQKIEQVPILEQYVAAQNEVITEVIDSLAINTKAGSLSINDSKVFLSTLSERIADMANKFIYEDCDILTKGSDKKQDVENELPFEYVKSLMVGKVNRGDIIMALPCHNNPKCVVDFGNIRYKVGHAEIFTRAIDLKSKIDEYYTIGAWTQEGVSEQTLNNWCCKSYVLGVCTYKTKYVWKGLSLSIFPEQTPINNPAALATWAEKYINKEYVKWYEFLTAKWAAPNRFTCTSLVWWCAKNAYDERISPWLSAIVSPSDVLMDSNTYIKVIIE